jgi:hypothetical protein
MDELTLGGPSGLLRDGLPCVGLNSNGYYSVMIDGKNLLVHRLVWILRNGEIPEGFRVDHKNGDRRDNSPSNLRLVTHAQNCQNKARKSYSYKHGAKWRAEVTHNYRKHRSPGFKSRDDAEEFGELLSRTLKGEFHRE